MKKVIILIDGSNFYFKLKDLKLNKLLQFNFSAFNKLIAGGDKIVSSTYYVGAVKTEGTKKSQASFDAQRQLLAHLKKHKVDYSLGYLLKSDGVFHEKGVDVNIALDILVAAYEDRADKIIVVSSDTDLIPAVKKAQLKGKIVHYVGFEHLPSQALLRNCTSSTLLTKAALEPFLK